MRQHSRALGDLLRRAQEAQTKAEEECASLTEAVAAARAREDQATIRLHHFEVVCEARLSNVESELEARVWQEKARTAQLEDHLQVAIARAAAQERIVAGALQRAGLSEILRAWHCVLREQQFYRQLQVEADNRAIAEAKHDSTARESVLARARIEALEADLAAMSRTPKAVCLSPAAADGLRGIAVRHTVILAVFAAWRTATESRRAYAALQTKVFREEAARTAALRAQKLDCDTRYMEAETRHRATVWSLRRALAEAESDFAHALRTAQDPAAMLEDAGNESGMEDSTTRSTGTDGEEPGRMAAAVRALRSRAEARLSHVEERHVQELRHEREKAAARIAELERTHAEALKAARGEVVSDSTGSR